MTVRKDYDLKRKRILRKDAPLGVEIKDQQLVIKIGIDTLAHAFETGEENNPYDELRNDFVKNYVVVDSQEFANDVRLALLDERENGSSELTDLLDKAFMAAVNDGSLGVMDACEIEGDAELESKSDTEV